jgi:hypothetical protein
MLSGISSALFFKNYILLCSPATAFKVKKSAYFKFKKINIPHSCALLFCAKTRLSLVKNSSSNKRILAVIILAGCI